MEKYISLFIFSILFFLTSCGNDKNIPASAAQFESKAACIVAGVEKRDCHFFFGYSFSPDLDEEMKLFEENIESLESQVKTRKRRMGEIRSLRTLTDDQVIELEELEKEVPILWLEIKGVENEKSDLAEKLEIFRRFSELSVDQKKELKEIKEKISNLEVKKSEIKKTISSKDSRIIELYKLSSLTEEEVQEFRKLNRNITQKENTLNYLKGRLNILLL